MPEPRDATRNDQTATSSLTRYVETKERRLAYRRIGQGPPLVLCLRLRGVMDVWDPAFLDALANYFTVITFDYTGLGQSTGTPTYKRESLASDAYDLVEALMLDEVIIGGWSLGGVAAQIFAAEHPERTSHAILIGTVPPGIVPYPAEQNFLPTALKPAYTLDDEITLFYEPTSPASRAAAQASHDRLASRTTDHSPPIPEEVYLRIVRESHDPQAVFPDHVGYAERLAAGTVPLLVISSDHDISFPVENWYALNRQWKSLHLYTFPQTGHGMQHEHPQACAQLIDHFVRHTKKVLFQ